MWASKDQGKSIVWFGLVEHGGSDKTGYNNNYIFRKYIAKTGRCDSVVSISSLIMK